MKVILRILGVYIVKDIDHPEPILRFVQPVTDFAPYNEYVNNKDARQKAFTFVFERTENLCLYDLKEIICPVLPKERVASNHKLYVWEGDDVLRDHTSGLIAVLARSFGEATRLIEEKYPEYMGKFPINKYKVIDTPEAFACYGSA